MTFGVNCTAIAGNPIYLEWACFSAKTVKKFMPSVRFSVYTNMVKEARKCGHIDDVLEAPDYPAEDWHGVMIDGILASEKLGYDVTLFTGADTAICDDMTEIFDLMATGKFDLALTQPRDQRKRRYPLRGVHEGFPYYNDGTQFFPWNDATRKFYRDWRDFQWTHKVECANSRKSTRSSVPIPGNWEPGYIRPKRLSMRPYITIVIYDWCCFPKIITNNSGQAASMAR